MLRRSQGAPDTHEDPEIDRTLRQIRSASQQCNRVEESSSDSESNCSEAMAGGGNDALFRDFGNPGSYELTGGIFLPTTETNFTIHPNYTQMVQMKTNMSIWINS